MPRRSRADVAESRDVVVRAAVDLASIEGLEGITIGRLAGELEMSKSGLIGRFGDKASLQQAALDAAVERFTASVWAPASTEPEGQPRLIAIVERWIDHLRDGVFPGGCFITTASVEYDARPGTLHDAVASTVDRWLATLAREAQIAIAAGDLPADRDADDVALELHSLASGGSVAARITDEPQRLERIRGAMLRTVGGAEAVRAAAPARSGRRP